MPLSVIFKDKKLLKLCNNLIVKGMARNDENLVIKELESVCHYLQRKNMEDISPTLY